MKPTQPGKEVNRIKQELDASKSSGQNPRGKRDDVAVAGSQAWKQGKKSLDAVVMSALS